MARRQYEWRRVLLWPNGTRVDGLPVAELQARDDHIFIQTLDFPREQGCTTVLERRTVSPWETVERVTLSPTEEDARGGA